MIKNVFQLAILCYAIFFSTAQAEFIEVDWKLQGDSAVTFDSLSGLEWMSLKETDFLSINDVKAELDGDGRFTGWRLPTEHEVESMMENVFQELIVEGDSSFKWDSNQTQIYTAFHSLFDWNYAYVKTGYPAKYDYRSYGLYETESGEVLMSGVRYTNLPKTSQTHKRVYATYLYEDYSSSVTAYDTDFKGTSYGVFLVSDGGFTMRTLSDVSSPITAMLPILGLFGLRRRK
jgi:hypothetical protein